MTDNSQIKVIVGMSGGVDSSVCAAIVHKAVGDQLVCVFVDHGLLREEEVPLVIREHARKYQFIVTHGMLWQRAR